MYKKKYTLLTSALQDHLIKELNLNLDEPFNKKIPKSTTLKNKQQKTKKGVYH